MSDPYSMNNEEPGLAPSRALVANDPKGNGVVLWCTANSQLEIEIEQMSMRLDDLGIDDAPAGISVWEGSYVWYPGSYEYPQDGSSEPRGVFRAPTDAEWQAVRDGRNPWS